MSIEVPPAAASGRELLEALPVAAVLLAPAGTDLRVEYANPAARREAGIALDGALVGERLPELRDAGLEVLRSGAPYEVEALDLGERVFELRAVRHGGGLLATFTDITGR